MLGGCIFSCGIEISQLIIGREYCQLDDMVTNTVEIRPDAMPEEESTVFRPDVIIRSGNLVMEISNTASEELIQKIRGLFHV